VMADGWKSQATWDGVEQWYFLEVI
jgi:hypothetical protein